jgi:hypothetical protein
MFRLVLIILFHSLLTNCVNPVLKIYKIKSLVGCGKRDKAIGMAYIHLDRLGKNPSKYHTTISDSLSIVIINLKVKPPAIGGGALLKVDTLNGTILDIKLYQ